MFDLGNYNVSIFLSYCQNERDKLVLIVSKIVHKLKAAANESK